MSTKPQWSPRTCSDILEPMLTNLHDGVVVCLHGALDGGEEGGVDEDGGERRPRRTHQGLQHVCKRERDWVRKEYPLVRYKSC